MKSFTERDPRIIGAVVVVVLAVLVTGSIVLNRSFFTSSYTLNARFSNAAGIKPGAEVLLAGVDVGRVGSVRQHGNSVIMGLDIDHGVTLPSDTGAAVAVQTLLGVVAVDLEPYHGWSHPLRSGATITDTSVPVEYFNLQNTAGHLLEKSNPAALNALITSLGKITAGKQAQVAQIIEGLNQITAVVDQRQAQVSQLIDAANVLSSTLQGRDTQLVSLIDNLGTVMQGLAARQGALAALIDNTDQVATRTANLVSTNRPQLDALISSLHTDLGIVASHQVDLAQAVAYLGSAFKGYASITYSGTNDTPNGPWANIYANLAGGETDSVLGSCGAFSQVMHLVLGPDPLPCSERTGPLPTPGSSTSAPAVASNQRDGASGASTGGGGSLAGGLTSPVTGGLASGSDYPSSTDPLQSLFAPFLGGGL